jgi:hypothetical protein
MPPKECRRFLVPAILSLIIVLLISSNAFAQEHKIKGDIRVPGQDTIQIITTNDGSTVIGRILSVRDTEITFKSNLGESNIPLANIKEIKAAPASSVKKGNYWFENPNATRLYFGPTARMLKQRQGYFSDCYIIFPSVAYGITDHITMGAGVSLVPGLDINKQVYYINPKIGLSATSNTSFALGGLLFALPEIDHKRNTLGIIYGVGTLGNPDGSLTLGLGYGMVNSDFANKPAVMFGGEKRFARRLSFVSENWIIPAACRRTLS